jgi:hypothetical protein
MAENGAGGDHTTAYLQLQERPTYEICQLSYVTVPFFCLFERIAGLIGQSSEHMKCKYMMIYFMFRMYYFFGNGIYQ